MKDNLPATIDRYDIEGLLGQGGQGLVYLARDPKNSHLVALKLMSPLSVGETARLRFLREFAAISKLNHSNIVRVFERGVWNNLLYFTMEYVRGDSIGKFLVGRRNLALVCHLMAQVAEALSYIHSIGMIHRDLKPGNILVDKEDTIKLTDFGLVKPKNVTTELTRKFSILGTISYASPEALNNDEVDPRSDLYSFGVVLYEMASGRLPFQSDSLAGLISKHILQEAPALKSIVPECPSELNDLCLQLMAKDPWKRPSTAESTARILRQIESSLESRSNHLSQIALKHGSPLYPRFIDREQELNQLIATVPSSANASFSITIVHGEGGIGKSRLFRESSVRAANQKLKIVKIPVVSKNCEPLDALDEFLTELGVELAKNQNDLNELRLLLPELSSFSRHFERFRPDNSLPPAPSSWESQSEKPNLTRYLVRVFARLTKMLPWLIILEDFQNIDAASIEILQEMIYWSNMECIHCSIWAALRDEDVQEDSHFQRFLDELHQNPRCRRITLHRLDYADSCRLVASMINQPPDSASVVRSVQLGNGHPLMLVETTRGWASNGSLIPKDGGWILDETLTDSVTLIPAPIKDILKKRLDVLSDETLDTLFWVATLDPDIDFAVLKYLDDDEESKILQRLNTLIHQKFIEEYQSEHGEKYRFRHVQMKELLLEMLGTDELSKRHQDVVDVLLNQDSSVRSLPRIASHQESAGKKLAAMRNWHDAGCESYEAQDFRKSEGYFKRADNLLKELSQEKLRHITPLVIQNLYMLVQIESMIGNLQQQEYYLDIIAPFLDQIRTPKIYFPIMLSKIMVMHTHGLKDDAYIQLESLERQLDPSDSIIQSRLHATKGFLAMQSADYSKSLQHYKLAYRLAPLKHRHTYLWCLGKLYSELQKYRSAERILNNALIEYQKRNQLGEQARTYSSLGYIRLVRQDPTHALELLNKALELHRTIGDEYWISCDQHDIAITLCRLNRHSEALNYFRDSQPYCYRNRLPREMIIGASNYIEALYHLGRLNEALSESDKALGAAQLTPLQYLYIKVGLANCILLAIFGQSDQANRRLSELSRKFHNHFKTDSSLKIQWLMTVAKLALSKGKIISAKKILTLLKGRVTQNPQAAFPPSMDRYAIVIQLSLFTNDRDNAIRHLKELVECIRDEKDSEFREDLRFYENLVVYLEKKDRNAWDSISSDIPRIQALPFIEYRLWLLWLIEWSARSGGLDEQADELRNAYLQMKGRISEGWPKDMRKNYIENRSFMGSII